ncbi:YiaA/YiaB family inner membrane protein, partial [Escherichia coli]|uniref:YiaA/YiaB family inner membrane protein n=1 Tax=Escherichia coli TaxID=562 RepID=UPI003748A0D3
SLKTSIKTITYLSDIGCLEIQGASLLFSAASYQKTVRDKYEGIPTTSIYYMTCLTVFIISVALLMVGLWNATLLLSEKGFYGLAFFLSLFGAVAVQKNIRDAGINPPKETQVTQEEYSE